MIITRLNGGLGNQMFQYATGRALSIRNNTTLFLDNSLLNTKSKKITSRRYELNTFNIIAEMATKSIMGKVDFVSDIPFWRVNKKIKLKDPIDCIRHVREPRYHTDFDIINFTGNICLEGYWQSEKYFGDCKLKIKEEFTPYKSIDLKSINLKKDLASHESVGIHIRGGDYITNRLARKHHGLCGIEYYIKSIELMKEHLNDPVFYIFSDDPVLCMRYMKLMPCPVVPTFTSKKEGYIDLFLMSSCRHQIITNSSFSWWAAWLGYHENQIVIAPKPWFQESTYNSDDVYCKHWITISTLLNGNTY